MRQHQGFTFFDSSGPHSVTGDADVARHGGGRPRLTTAGLISGRVVSEARRGPHRSRGITLIELVVVIGIIAILASLATSSYARYRIKANRSAAASFVFGVANRQEQFYLDARAYAANLAALGVGVPSEVAENYTIATTANNGATPPTYSVTATPKGRQLSLDTKCATLTLGSSGAKSVSGSGPAAECW